MRVSSPKAEPVLAEALARGLRRNGFAVAIARHTAPRAGDDGMTASG
jgi:hypothetical protein